MRVINATMASLGHGGVHAADIACEGDAGNFQYDLAQYGSVYEGDCGDLLRDLAKHPILINGRNSHNRTFGLRFNSGEIECHDANNERIEWIKMDVLEYLKARVMGVGLFFTTEGRLVSDNFTGLNRDLGDHVFVGGPLPREVRRVEWHEEPIIHIRNQTNPQQVISLVRQGNGYFIVQVGMASDLEWTADGGPVFHDPPASRGRSIEDMLRVRRREKRFVRAPVGEPLEVIPQFLHVLRREATAMNAVRSQNRNTTGKLAPNSRTVEIIWGSEDLRVYRQARASTGGIVLWRDGHLYVMNSESAGSDGGDGSVDEVEERETLRNESFDSRASDEEPQSSSSRRNLCFLPERIDDSWASDDEPIVYIPNARDASVGVALTPINGGFYRQDFWLNSE